MKSSKENLTKEQRKLIKAQSRAIKIHNEYVKNYQQDKVTVLCVRFGNRYGRSYVERLRNMVSRNLTIPYEFVCLTDDQNPIEGVRSIVQKPGGYLKLWWHKVHMFDQNLPISGRILYFDLDIVIHNNIDKLIEVCGTDFYGCCDFNRKFYPKWNTLNSSVMSWIHGTQTNIYEIFMKDKVIAQRLHGDQDWIWKIAKSSIKFYPYEWIQSYKWEIRSREELIDRTGKKGFKTINETINVHPLCSVAVFHGDPKPQDIKDKLIIDHWK